MKRKAILLGHADGQLSAKKDVDDMIEFLLSDLGGAWHGTEIFRKMNMGLDDLDKLLSKIRTEHYDYLFFYFSGHGECVRDTVIELNPSGEVISESALSGLAVRQLNIFDCCRCYSNSVALSNGLDSMEESVNSVSEIARYEYEKRVMAAASQQVTLYACSEGMKAYDFGNGGVYTQNLLNAARSLDGDVVLVSQAHGRACEMTKEISTSRGYVQNPDYFMAKLPSRYQLPFAIKVANMLKKGVL